MTNISMSLVSALYNMQLLKLFGADGVAAYGVLMYVGLCVRGGVHRLFSGHSAHCQLPLWRGQ